MQKGSFFAQTALMGYLICSSGKGIAHTLARRAAFFLATGEPHLALRHTGENSLPEKNSTISLDLRAEFIQNSLGTDN
jgi:hypothetical protein